MEQKDIWMETWSGHKFHIFDLENTIIDVNDIAISLSRQCRFKGHTNRYYSVAEHTCLMSDWVMLQLWATATDGLIALHHDDAEYIMGDLPSPLKAAIPQFRELEDKVDIEIAKRFDLQFPFPVWLKEIDQNILVDERMHVMNPSNNNWTFIGDTPLGVEFWHERGTDPDYAKEQWLSRHYELTRIRHEQELNPDK